MRYWIVLIVGALICLQSVGLAAEEARTFTDRNLGYRLSYPPTMLFSRDARLLGPGKQFYLFYFRKKPDTMGKNEPNPYLLLMLEEGVHGELDLPESATLEGDDEFRTEHVRFRRVTYTLQRPGLVLRERLYITADPGKTRTYRFVVSDTESHGDTYFKGFEKVLETFAFQKS